MRSHTCAQPYPLPPAGPPPRRPCRLHAQTGGNSGLGSCRDACKDCEKCAKTDLACYARNREKGGFLNFDPREAKGLMEG